MKPFKVRCHAIGRIMTDARGATITEKQLTEINELIGKKNLKGLTPIQTERLAELIAKRDAPPELGDTAKQYVLERFIAHKYGRTRDTVNRYVTKGLMVEEDSITLFTRVMFKRGEGEFYTKNTDHFENNFCTGTPDLFGNKRKRVIDTKSSWDIFTFFNAKRAINPHNEWQVHGYMGLTNAEQATIAYCLVDTPESLIDREIRALEFKEGLANDSNAYREAAEVMRRTMVYADIPIEERLHTWTVERDDAKLKAIEERVKLCGEYYNSLF